MALEVKLREKLESYKEAGRTRVSLQEELQAFMLSPIAQVEVEAYTEIITAANKRYHIADEYCVKVASLVLSDELAEMINNSVSCHYDRYTKKLFITPLIADDEDTLNILESLNIAKISKALKKSQSELYQLIGKEIKVLNPHLNVPSNFEEDTTYIRHCQIDSPYVTHVRHRTRTGKIRWVTSYAIAIKRGDKIFTRGVDIDVTKQWTAEKELKKKNRELRIANKELEKLSLKDHLTGLPNRKMLEIKAESAISELKRYSEINTTCIGILYMDLIFFKYLNDKNPKKHAGGDDALREVTSRLKETISRETDIIARVGGDEFVVLLVGLKKPSDIDTVISRINKQMAQPFFIGGKAFDLEFSIGSSLYKTDYLYPDKEPIMIFETLCSIADQRMNENKKARHGELENNKDPRIERF